jgi:hypothetical protein
MRGASLPCFQFVAVLPVSRRARCTAVALPVFQRQSRCALSATSPLASPRQDLQTDRRRKARATAAEKYRRIHQKGTPTTLTLFAFSTQKRNRIFEFVTLASGNLRILYTRKLTSESEVREVKFLLLPTWNITIRTLFYRYQIVLNVYCLLKLINNLTKFSRKCCALSIFALRNNRAS